MSEIDDISCTSLGRLRASRVEIQGEARRMDREEVVEQAEEEGLMEEVLMEEE